jgi:hypothetical protein
MPINQLIKEGKIDATNGNKSGAVDRDCFLRMKRQSGWSDYTLVRVP